MKHETRLNGNPLGLYGANLVGFSVGPCERSKSYLIPSGRLIPVKLTYQIGLRRIALECDFEGRDYREIAMNISKVTSMLQKEAKLFLPDGFYYWCELDSVSEPKEKAPWIERVTFSFSGFRHDRPHTEVVTNGSVVNVEGNCNTPVKVVITPSDGASTVTFGDITVNSVEGTITIDGIYTTITDEDGNNIFSNSNMTEWPFFKPGKNPISVTGASKVEVTYYPIYL